MKKWILNITLSVLLFSCMENGVVSPTPSAREVKTETKYKITDQSNSKIHIKEFNNQGNLIKFIQFENENASKISEFEYKDGLKVEKVTDNIDGEKNHIIEYRENDSGVVSKIIRFDDSGNKISSQIREYDSFGRITKKIELDLDSSETESITTYNYQFDKYGRLKYVEVFGVDDQIIKYDSLIYRSNQITRITLNPDGQIQKRTEINYNKAGKVESELVFNSKNEITCHYTYIYTFYQ